MFERCIYQNNQLADVICQLRFPEILRIGAEPPAEFQEKIRKAYPLYSVKDEAQPAKLSGAPGNLRVENGSSVKNYQFTSADGIWRINLSTTFISLACTRYPDWEKFAARLDQPLAAFIQLYQPSFFTRIGLRYMNFISRVSLGLEGTPYCDLFRPAYLGVLNDGLISENAAVRSTVDAEYRLADGTQVRLHAGPGMVTQNGHTDQEAKFIFDQDLYVTENLPVQQVASRIQMLHSHAFPIFRNAITDLLHNAMQPE